MTLKIVTKEEHPFIIKTVKNGKVSYEGCCIDILKAIQKELLNDKFNYEVYEVEDNQYGVEVDGRWTGLIGQLLLILPLCKICLCDRTVITKFFITIFA